MPHGALVCMPDRHTLGVHVLGHNNLLSALAWLIMLGEDDYFDAPYPLSPRVHWWHGGELTPVSGANGDLGAVADGRFIDTLERVAGCSLEEAVRRDLALKSRRVKRKVKARRR